MRNLPSEYAVYLGTPDSDYFDYATQSIRDLIIIAMTKEKDHKMRDEKLMLLRGAAEYVKSMPWEFNEDVRAAGIRQDEWEALRTNIPWRPQDREKARYAFEKALQWTQTLAGLPPTPVTDHYLAASICGLVCPINWRSASYFGIQGLDGVRLMQADGDIQSAREAITPERLFALVTYAFDNVHKIPGLLRKQEHEDSLADMQTAQPDVPPSGKKGKANA